MLKFLNNIKLDPLPTGRYCYLFNLPRTQPIDNYRKYESDEIQEELKDLEIKRESYEEKLENFEPIYDKVMRSVRRVKFGINTLEKFLNEPKPYKILLKPDQYYVIDDTLEKDIKLMVMFDDINSRNCDIEEAMRLHCEELKVTYKYMLELEWDLSWLDYQLEVIFFNKRYFCECERKNKQLVDDATIEPSRPIKVKESSESQLGDNCDSEFEDIIPINIYTSGNQDLVSEKESELYKELNELANQQTDLSIQQVDLDEESLSETCKKNRKKLTALIQQIGHLEVAHIMASDPNFYHDNE